MMLQPDLDATILLLFLSSEVYKTMHTRSANDRLLTGGILRLRVGFGIGRISPIPAPTKTPAEIADSNRLKLRSRL